MTAHAQHKKVHNEPGAATADSKVGNIIIGVILALMMIALFTLAIIQ